MKKSSIILTVLLAILVMSCNKNRIYETHKGGFPDYRWEKNKIVEFNPEITDINPEHKVYLAFRYIYGFQLKEIVLKAKMTSPSGEITESNHTVTIISKSGEIMSDCAGDFCDVETLIYDNYTFPETGKYKFEITYDMPLKFMANVIEVGVIVDKIAE